MRKKLWKVIQEMKNKYSKFNQILLAKNVYYYGNFIIINIKQLHVNNSDRKIIVIFLHIFLIKLSKRLIILFELNLSSRNLKLFQSRADFYRLIMWRSLKNKNGGFSFRWFQRETSIIELKLLFLPLWILLSKSYLLMMNNIFKSWILFFLFVD